MMVSILVLRTVETFLTLRRMDTFASDLVRILIANGVERGDLIGLDMDQ